jgi:hypothetical protein
MSVGEGSLGGVALAVWFGDAVRGGLDVGVFRRSSGVGEEGRVDVGLFHGWLADQSKVR